MDNQNEPSMTQLGTSTSAASTGRSLASGQSPNQSLCGFSKATERARLLVGCYRKGEAEDSDVYLTALVTILCGYPESVVVNVTDPRTGVPGESKWLPTIADVRHACEMKMQPMRDEEERQRRRAESDRVLNGEPEPREKRKSFADLAAMYPDIVGTKVKRPPTDAEKAAALAMLESRRDYLRSPLAPSPRLAATNLVNQAILDAVTDDEDGNR